MQSEDIGRQVSRTEETVEEGVLRVKHVYRRGQ